MWTAGAGTSGDEAAFFSLPFFISDEGWCRPDGSESVWVWVVLCTTTQECVWESPQNYWRNAVSRDISLRRRVVQLDRLAERSVDSSSAARMPLATIGALIPRDFLERQPKRWQKSQKKRRVLGTLRKMKAKREKLEQNVIAQAERDAGIVTPKKKKKAEEAKQPEPPNAPSAADAPVQALPPSHSTPIGRHESGVWAAELTPYSALVVKIPAGVQLCLVRASLSSKSVRGGGRVSGVPNAVADGDDAISRVRCRTPAKKTPSTLCLLQPHGEETCGLSTIFTSRDVSCALAVEGPEPVHIIGCYTRADASTAAEESGATGLTPRPPPKSTATGAEVPMVASSQVVHPRTAPSKSNEEVPAKAAAAPSGSAGTTQGLVELSDGLKLVDVKKGSGRKAARGDRLTVKYTGLAPSGGRAGGGWKEFDSNQGKALHFSLGEGEMIRGWDIGLVGMRCGGTRRLVVPPSLGYGERGAGPVPPGATLIFEIQLINVV